MCTRRVMQCMCVQYGNGMYSYSPFSIATGTATSLYRSVGRYGSVMTDSWRLQQHHTTSDDPGQGCKAHEGGIRP